MAINQAVCASFKKQLLEGDHDIDNDTINLALYTNSVTLNGNTTAYSATNEVGNSGTYAAGGITLTSPTIGLTATKASATTDSVPIAVVVDNPVTDTVIELCWPQKPSPQLFSPQASAMVMLL